MIGFPWRSLHSLCIPVQCVCVVSAILTPSLVSIHSSWSILSLPFHTSGLATGVWYTRPNILDIYEARCHLQPSPLARYHHLPIQRTSSTTYNHVNFIPTSFIPLYVIDVFASYRSAFYCLLPGIFWTWEFRPVVCLD